MNKINWLLFFILVFFIGLLQYFLLRLVFNYGFTPDDWGLLLFYKSLGNDPLSKIAYVWSVKGAYTSSQVYFIGILNSFFGLNYEAYQITNIILKTLATLSLFPLVLVIFKRRLLAFLTTILYGMSYMGSRSLEYVVKGTDYLAIIPMSLFFIIYYYIVKEKLKGRWFFLMSFFFFISLAASPIRMYPILALIPMIEVFLWMQNRLKITTLNSFKRLLVLYLPFLLIYLYNPNSISAFLQTPPTIYRAILDGNWHLILTPFQGAGLTFLTNEFWSKLINNLSLTGGREYLSFLIRGPTVIFGFFILVLAVTKSKKPGKFFFRAFFANILLDIIFYFLATHELIISENLRLHFDPSRMYQILISGFMLSISFASFLEWRDSEKKDDLLIVLWISPLITLLYTFLIWILAPFGVGFEGQQEYYLILPAISTSLFLSATLISIYDKISNQKTRILRLISGCGILMFLLYFYFLNKNNIYYYFSSAGINGRYALDQEKMYNQVKFYLEDNFNWNESTLFYFDVSEDGQRGTFYTESLLSNLAIRMRIQNGAVVDGCTGVFYEALPSLAKLITIKHETTGFTYQGQCIANGSGGNTSGVFYNINNFYAFKLKDGELLDIRQEVLERLKFR